MKVLFIEDVPNVARAGETKVVADGYGRNYLLPRKLAVMAGSQASTQVTAHIKKVEKQRALNEAAMQELAARLEGMEITIKAKAGAKERLYGSVTSADIAEELSRQSGGSVDKRKVELAEPIHQLGSYDVTVRFTSEITAVIKLTVTGEETEAAEAGEKPAEEAEKSAEEVEKPAEAPEAVAAETPAGEAVEAEAAEEKAEGEEEAKAEKKEKKTRAKKEKAAGEEAAGEEAKAEKKEKKTKAKKEETVEEAGDKDAEPGE